MKNKENGFSEAIYWKTENEEKAHKSLKGTFEIVSQTRMIIDCIRDKFHEQV